MAPRQILGGIADVGLVKHFVRTILRCSCPKEVFSEIQIGVPRLFDGRLRGRIADVLVGRRLLVTVVRTSEFSGDDDAVRALLREGKRIRDQSGFNRFRLVFLGRMPRVARVAIERRAAMMGERVHVHFVRVSEVPRLQRNRRRASAPR